MINETDPSATANVMNLDRDTDGAEKSFDSKWGLYRRRAAAGAIGLAALAIVGGTIKLLASGDSKPPPRKVAEITVVKILPPPPPPPPKPQEKMVEQTPVKDEIQEEQPVDRPKDEPKPQEAKDEPPPGPLSLDAKGTGPGDAFGLGGKPGGRGILGGGGGSRWGWYASILQQQIQAALRSNARTRNAVMQITVRLWVDSSGRVSRSQMVSSSGNPDVDAAIRNEVLPGITLREPPPKDMPMPIVARISERRPS